MALPNDDTSQPPPRIVNTPKGGFYGSATDLSGLDPNVVATLMGYRWATTFEGSQAPTKMFYAFPTSTDAYFRVADYPAEENLTTFGFNPASPLQKAAVVTGFNQIASYTKLTFAEDTSPLSVNATFRFSDYTPTPERSEARFPSNDKSPHPDYRSDSRDAGDVFLGQNGKPGANFFGTDDFTTIIHEMGHAVGLKHGHDGSLNGALAPRFNDVEFSLMTYASYLGAPISPPAGPVAIPDGSSPQSFMMFDIAALQAMYGANFGRLGTKVTYSWDIVTGQQRIDNESAPDTGVSSTKKIFSTVWTQGAAATFDLRAFAQDQVDDLRPGQFLKFSTPQLADLRNAIAPDTPGITAQGNIYNALLYKGDLHSAIAGLVTGAGNDTLIGNDRDNQLTAGAGADILVASGGNDLMSGGAGADIFQFGPGHSIVRDSLADLNGDVMRDLGFGGVDVLGTRFGWENVSLTATMATVTVGGSSFQLNGNFASGGEFMITTRGAGSSVHTSMNFVDYLPSLAEGVTVNPAAIQGIANQPFLTGDGAARFTAELKSAVSAFANTVGYYKIAADGTISDVHVLFDNSLTVTPGSRIFDIGTPGNGERIGFFLIQDGFNNFGHLSGDLSFKALNLTSAANADGGAAVLFSSSQGALTQAQVFHSLAALNPNGANQTLSGIAPGNHQLQIGFEDLPRASGDNDFQDVVLAVWATQDVNQLL